MPYFCVAHKVCNKCIHESFMYDLVLVCTLVRPTSGFDLSVSPAMVLARGSYMNHAYACAP